MNNPDPTRPRSRHPREDGDPVTSLANEAKALDSRLRGNDGEGADDRGECLPYGGIAVRLDDVCTILDSRRIPISEKERTKRLACSRSRYSYYGATGQVGEIDGFIFECESVLLVEDGAPFL